MKLTPTKAATKSGEPAEPAEALVNQRSQLAPLIGGGRKAYLSRLHITKPIFVAAAISLLPLIYFYPAVVGQAALVQGDGYAANLGLRVLTGRLLRQGMVPLWDPYIFGGMPLLASIYPGALYPPNWVFAFLPPSVAMQAVVITTYHVALLGSYLYARRVGVGRVGALVTGVVFAFSGYMVIHLGSTSNIAAAAWLPWILLAIERLYQQASWRWVALGAVFVAVQLFAGVPQINAYTVLVGGAYGLFSATLRGGRRWRFVAAAGAMAVCGALLSAVQLLPLRELQQQSPRAQISYEYFSAFSFPPAQILTFVFPYFFGGAARPPYQNSYWGREGAETFGYVGLLTWLLVSVALFGLWHKMPSCAATFKEGSPAQTLTHFEGQRRLIGFWAGVAVVSMVLAFGAYLPFNLNHLLHRVPVYNLFRVSARHLLEFTFATAVLAGIGLSSLARMGRQDLGRTMRRSSAVFVVMLAAVAVIYHFFGQHLVTTVPRPAQAGSFTDPALLVPLAFSALSLAALWLYAWRPGPASGAVIVAVLVADLAAFGHFLDWRNITFNVYERLGDPPSVKYIKDREPDLNAFRILSQAEWPYDSNYELLDHPDASIARGLQSVNGYDMLRPDRPAALAGDMTPVGLVERLSVFDLPDQGLNLLNVKYLLRERPGRLETGRGLVYDGIRFSESPLDLKLGPGAQAGLAPGGVAATELAVISAMGNSTEIPDGSPVLTIRLHTRQGGVIERQLLAGRDTAEWAYDRPDVMATAKHRRAHVAESYPAEGFQGHRYLARLAFERAEVERIELAYLRPDAGLLITRASLFDATTGTSTALDAVRLPPERWRKLASFGEVELYENLRRMPRAWFVRRRRVLPGAEVLRTITEGKAADGASFDPAETALLEQEDFGSKEVALPELGELKGAEVKLNRYEPQRIEIETRNPELGFLVVSEVYYQGWEAVVDGQPSPVYRTDYALRGIEVPAGAHRVELVFRSPSFRRGALCSALGAAILLLGGVLSRAQSGRQLRRAG